MSKENGDAKSGKKTKGHKNIHRRRLFKGYPRKKKRTDKTLSYNQDRGAFRRDYKLIVNGDNLEKLNEMGKSYKKRRDHEKLPKEKKEGRTFSERSPEEEP